MQASVSLQTTHFGHLVNRKCYTFNDILVYPDRFDITLQDKDHFKKVDLNVADEVDFFKWDDKLALAYIEDDHYTISLYSVTASSVEFKSKLTLPYHPLRGHETAPTILKTSMYLFMVNDIRSKEACIRLVGLDGTTYTLPNPEWDMVNAVHITSVHLIWNRIYIRTIDNKLRCFDLKGKLVCAFALEHDDIVVEPQPCWVDYATANATIDVLQPHCQVFTHISVVTDETRVIDDCPHMVGKRLFTNELGQVVIAG